jgi:hypothetical protein
VFEEMKVAAGALGALLLAGCTTLTLPVQGQVEGLGEQLSGTATGHMDGAGELQLTSSTGSQCQGNFVYVTPREGSGTLTCSDGRTGPFDFASTGSRGTGQGKLDGVPFVFTFGR